MPYWIIKMIEGRRIHTCSDCGAEFNAYFFDVTQHKNCPCCGRPIEEDKNEQVRNL
jgi:uncharacterized paraquat-inducible protein A